MKEVGKYCNVCGKGGERSSLRSVRDFRKSDAFSYSEQLFSRIQLQRITHSTTLLVSEWTKSENILWNGLEKGK